MKKGTFTVTLEFSYDVDTKKIEQEKVVKINGKTGEESRYFESIEDTYIGTIGTTVILTKSAKEADPCAWIWNPTLGTWVWSCWNSDSFPVRKN